jgi:hypothetical protein
MFKFFFLKIFFLSSLYSSHIEVVFELLPESLLDSKAFTIDIDSITNSAEIYEAKHIKNIIIVLNPNPANANIEGIIKGPVPNITFIIVNTPVAGLVILNLYESYNN